MLTLELPRWQTWKQLPVRSSLLEAESLNPPMFRGSVGLQTRTEEMALQEGPLLADFWAPVEVEGGTWQGGQPTSLASICIFISPPHRLAVLGSPHCPQCPWLRQGWGCQTASH